VWKKRGLRALAVVAGLAVAAELAGRAIGIDRPVIYEKTTYGYRVAPNQDLRRFGNRSFYNAEGLRSELMNPLVAPGTLRVLCLGDSVTNGGAITDQADTFPYRLQELLGRGARKVEVLNASAPGWAIANELGWLRDNGIFQSDVVVLTLSTHDLFQEIAPPAVVGTHPSFPGKRPLFALQDAWEHYARPFLFPSIDTADPGVANAGAEDAPESEPQARLNREDVMAIESIVRQQGGLLLVLLLSQGSDRNDDGLAAAARRQLSAALAARGVPLLNIDDDIRRQGRAALYRDDVHPNPVGNHAIAAVLAAGIARLLPEAQQPVEDKREQKP
jgi:lysophospholipase L1-like esterase